MIIAEKVYFYNENMGLVTEFDVDTKRYHIKVSTDNWLAAVILSNGVYSKPILYEKIEDLSVGSLYKRSSFLPEMVGKKMFLQAVQAHILNLSYQ